MAEGEQKVVNSVERQTLRDRDRERNDAGMEGGRQCVSVSEEEHNAELNQSVGLCEHANC